MQKINLGNFKNKRTWITLGVSCVVLLIFLRACHFSSNQSNLPITVSVGTVKQQDVTLEASAVGNVQAYSTVSVKSLVDGQLLSVGFKEGDMVTAKQLLFEIDPRPFQIALDQAKANLEKDKAQLATAQLSLKRNTPLLKKGYIAKQDYDQLYDNMNGLAATVAADQAAVENAQLQLSYCQIYAPIDGRTGNLLIKPGNLVKANDTNALVIINQVAPIYVVFNLPETQLAAIQAEFKHPPISVIASLDKDKIPTSLSGELTFIDNSVDTTTGTIQLKATFSNDELTLWPGEFVNIKIPLMHLQNALLVPTNAIQLGPNGSYVFVVQADQRVKMQSITVGPSLKGETVVKEGVTVGTQIVTAGQMQLTDGTLVEVER